MTYTFILVVGDQKPTLRVVSKGSELQAQLAALQESLKKTEEKLASVEKEKEKALNELKEAQKLSEDTNEKLREALVSQKNAEETIEIEKFRAIEMEQAGIESTQKKEEKWEKELESVKTQHDADVAALVSATQELEKVKQELTMTSDAKDQALTHAEDATKIAENQLEKVETLSTEITRLKGLLNAKFESEADQSNKMVAELNLTIQTLKSEVEQNEKTITELKSEGEENEKLVSDLKSEVKNLKSEEEELRSEIESLNQEVRKAKVYKEKLAHVEASFEELNVELEAAKMSESYAHSLMEEWKTKVEELDHQAEEAKRVERSTSSSLESTVKELETSNGFLKKAETELSSLKEKVGLLEMSNTRQRGDLEESERTLQKVKQEASEMTKKSKLLEKELETVKDERKQALDNEKLAAGSVQNLLEEKNKLISELESSKADEEKSKKALESLASALHEVSSEAREAKEKLLFNQSENENFEAQIEDLKHALQSTNEKYQNMLDNAKHEIDMLMDTIEQGKKSHNDTESEWKEKEVELMDSLKNSKEENLSLEKEVKRLAGLLSEEEEEGTQTKNLLKESESEVNYLKEILGDAKGESMNLKERLMDKENEMQSLDQEISELKTREAENAKKVDDLMKLLEEKEKERIEDVTIDVSDSEKDYDMLPKVVEFSEHNGGAKTKTEPLIENETVQNEPLVKDVENDVNGEHKESEKVADSEEVEFKMWESCKIEEKYLSPEREQITDESFEEEADSKTEENVENGGSSPLKQDQQQVKKKKALLGKFGSLLKKKGPKTNPK